jgi:hypothetical protein
MLCQPHPTKPTVALHRVDTGLDFMFTLQFWLTSLKKTLQLVAFKALMIIYSSGAMSPILFYQTPGDFYADLRIPLQKL